MMQSKRCLILGRVQGVFYRQSTLNEANQLGITGWVKNLPTGEVECVLSGEEQKLEKMCQWLWQGPATAQVSEVKVEDIPYQEYPRFEIKR